MTSLFRCEGCGTETADADGWTYAGQMLCPSCQARERCTACGTMVEAGALDDFGVCAECAAPYCPECGSELHEGACRNCSETQEIEREVEAEENRLHPPGWDEPR